MTTALPWRYPYQADSPRQREVLRPIVSTRLVGADISTPVLALVDSGSEHILAAPWLASDVAADLTQPRFVRTIWIAGGNPEVKFVDLRIRLQSPSGDDDDFIEWEAEVGFVDHWRAPWPLLLGQYGFFNQFTVSMHRSAGLTIVEDWTTFDERFGVEPNQADDRRRRFDP